eukprot:gene9930-10085_t
MSKGFIETCFGLGLRQQILEDENAWLKRMVAREQLTKKTALQEMQWQLSNEKAKRAVLQQEMEQVAQAAQEMGESLCMYFSRSDCDSMDHEQSENFDHKTGALQQSAGQDDLQATPSQQADINDVSDQALTAAASPGKDSYSVPLRVAALRCSTASTHNKTADMASAIDGPETSSSPVAPSHGNSVLFKRQMKTVAEQLKGLAHGWQQRLEAASAGVMVDQGKSPCRAAPVDVPRSLSQVAGPEVPNRQAITNSSMPAAVPYQYRAPSALDSDCSSAASDDCSNYLPRGTGEQPTPGQLAMQQHQQFHADDADDEGRSLLEQQQQRNPQHSAQQRSFGTPWTQRPPGAIASGCAITRGAGAKRVQASPVSTTQAEHPGSSGGGASEAAAGLAADSTLAEHSMPHMLVKARGIETVPLAAAELSSMSSSTTCGYARSSCMAADMTTMPSAATGPGSLHHHVTATQRQKQLRPLCSLNEEVHANTGALGNQLAQRAPALRLCPSAMLYMDLNEMSPLSKNRQGLRNSISSLRMSMAAMPSEGQF